MDREIDGPINKLSDRWTDEQIDGWISGRVNGWMDRHFYTWLSVCIPVMFKADFSLSHSVCVCVDVDACVCIQTYATTFFLCVYMCQAAVFSRQVILKGCASDGKMILIQKGRFDFCLDHSNYMLFVV